MARPAVSIPGGEPVKKEPFPAWPAYDERGREAVLEVLKSRVWWRTLGARTLKFEKEFAAYHRAKRGVAVTHGTAALEAAMAAVVRAIMAQRYPGPDLPIADPAWKPSA